MASSLSPSLPTIFSTLISKPNHRSQTLQLSFFPKKLPSLFMARSADNGTGGAAASAVVEEKVESMNPPAKIEEVKDTEESLSSNGVAVENAEVLAFKDPRWVGGTWDLTQFSKGGETDWDAVIDAEARRRKWLEDNPEASSTVDPVVFDTSIVPWWAWVKRYHLPEAELLNGRAAMIGFFMAYFVDSLTGVGLVDQMGNFFCKILLLISVGGVMLIRKNEDIEKLKKLIEETTFYDKQWQATWQEDYKSDSKN
ncbi:hypothetical protein KFK09_007616 [Dendrobium nobile]|uniref:Lil3 protein n=1 Tax=Dendrobium nobile TaxID=94219 RepID=A0A8T3BSD1_DENNO|nr:hypothetical protein KFK09_007616 [Dendrobium nobile]